MVYCRACLAEEPSMEGFFEMDKSCYFSVYGRTFREVLNSCTHLEISLEDGFSQCICSNCVKDLQIANVFIQKVLKSDEELRSNFKTNKIEAVCDGSSVKDPLENVVDDDEEEKSGETVVYGKFDDRNLLKNIPKCIDNKDNRFDDFSHMAPLISPSPSDSDKDDGDFLVSVESQIFPQGRFKCKLCEKTYFTNMGLDAHMDIHTQRCNTNAKESTKTSSKNRGRRKKNKTACEDSDGEDGDDEVLANNSHEDKTTRHKDSQPKPKKMFPCQVCGKQMISASKLRYHMVMHTGEKDYLCTMCPKAYSTIYALKHHMRAHTGERPYECKFCGDRFLRPTTLKSHMRRHTGERPYGCDICGKRFIQHSSLATHMKLNHMDKTIICPYCDKKYARQTDLNTHLLSHSGDKPFACKICPSRFTRQSNLNKHMNQQHHPSSGEISITDNRKFVQFPIRESNLNEVYILPYAKNKSKPSSAKTMDQAPFAGEVIHKSIASNSTSTSTEISSPHSDIDKLIAPSSWSWQPN